jgi:hypothetical protein
MPWFKEEEMRLAREEKFNRKQFEFSDEVRKQYISD